MHNISIFDKSELYFDVTSITFTPLFLASLAAAITAIVFPSKLTQINKSSGWIKLARVIIFPDSQWWQAQYESCSWYNLACHIRNAAIWIVNNIPDIKQVNELASGVGKIFQTIYSFLVKYSKYKNLVLHYIVQ
ncbi:MAG: hypothetical protein SPLM_02270 [Spiroplasma phoeniceum]